MAPRIPVLDLLDIHQSEVRLVNQGRGLQRLAGLLIREFDGSEFAKFVVDKWQKPFGGGRITVLDFR